MDHNLGSISASHNFTPVCEIQERILEGELLDRNSFSTCTEFDEWLFESVFFPRNLHEEQLDLWEEDDIDNYPDWDDDIYGNFHCGENDDDPMWEEIDITWTRVGYSKGLIARYHDHWPRYMLSDDAPSLKEFSEQETWEQWEREIAKLDKKSRNWRKELWEYEAFLASERELTLLTS